MNITIHYLHKTILLTNDSPVIIYDSATYIHTELPSTLLIFTQLINEPNYNHFVFNIHSPAIALAHIQHILLPITAAGGVVSNGCNEILLMLRLGKWDLPKGKLDDGESIENCAIREIQEETGLQHACITNKLTKTYHIYYAYEQWVIKTIHWYCVQAKPPYTIMPQLSEGIELLQWVNINDIAQYYNQTYGNIISVLDIYKNQLRTT